MAKPVLLQLIIILLLSACHQNTHQIMRSTKYISVAQGIQLYVETFGDPENEACL